ncbi:uncharacterized protein E0L32_010861 [Thyridium curvatum]|uniref:Uncharacterized protein n=1 Tax=Thyridium curvatum TaxID=1093900 RepID=A0A507AK10_9PEZI|nr:uncharacterized protein E0L32_010861 [Thyridium curvatum]TPX07267.1 hypothetical protein E0L32_010861 [Thyridium curvatum]
MEDVFQDLARPYENPLGQPESRKVGFLDPYTARRLETLYKQLKGLSETNPNDVKAVKRVTQAIVRVLNPTDPFGLEEDEPEDTPTGRVKEDGAGEKRPHDVVSQEESKQDQAGTDSPKHLFW